MKYEITISGADREMADKLYKMAIAVGLDVEVEEVEDEKPKGKGVLASVTEDD